MADRDRTTFVISIALDRLCLIDCGRSYNEVLVEDALSDLLVDAVASVRQRSPARLWLSGNFMISRAPLESHRKRERSFVTLSRIFIGLEGTAAARRTSYKCDVLDAESGRHLRNILMRQSTACSGISADPSTRFRGDSCDAVSMSATKASKV